MAPGVRGMDYIFNYTLSLRATEAAKFKHLLICNTSPVARKGGLKDEGVEESAPC